MTHIFENYHKKKKEIDDEKFLPYPEKVSEEYKKYPENIMTGERPVIWGDFLGLQWKTGSWLGFETACTESTLKINLLWINSSQISKQDWY